MSQSGRLNAPSSVQARRMATISACAVGSLLDVTSFQPSEMIVLFRTMTAPNGPPLFARAHFLERKRDRALHECLFGPRAWTALPLRARTRARGSDEGTCMSPCVIGHFALGGF